MTRPLRKTVAKTFLGHPFKEPTSGLTRLPGAPLRPASAILTRFPRFLAASLAWAAAQATGRVPRHAGKREQPQNSLPASAPCFATRRTIGLPQRGQVIAPAAVVTTRAAGGCGVLPKTGMRFNAALAPR